MAVYAHHWPDGAHRPHDLGRFGGAGEAMNAVSRLLDTASGTGGPSAVAERLVREARAFFRVDRAILLSVAELEGRLEVAAMEPPGKPPEAFLALSDLPPLAVLRPGDQALRVAGGDAAALGSALGAGDAVRSALMLPVRMRQALRHVLVLADSRHRDFTAEELEVATAFAAAAGAGLAQLQLAAMAAAQTARQAALARAAKSLGESLELNRVLVRICEEAARILGSDYANVFLGNASEGLRLEAAYGLPPDVIGVQVGAGEGLVGKVVERGEPMLTNDHPGISCCLRLPQLAPVRSSLAVPMHWDGELRGALAVGYFKPYLVTHKQLALLEAFADLAAAACRNASAHAGLALAARTDGLTGCLNHAALQDSLRQELERCRRTGHSLSLAIVDLDDFKQVNERHGHLAGDEVLRRVGQALRHGVRTYDLVARYGGDEFAIVAIDAGEREAAEVAARAIEGVARAAGRLEHHDVACGATAGVAEWRAGETQTELIARADRALLYGKQQGSRGVPVRVSELPADFPPAGARREPATLEVEDWPWSERAREQTERLRKRTRQLALANTLAARVSTMTNEVEIVRASVDELHRAFEHFLSAVLRVRGDGYLESVAVGGAALPRLGSDRWAQPLESGLIGRCIRERRPVISGDVRSEPDYRLVPGMEEVHSELVVPIRVGGELWGAIDLEEVRPDAFDEDDARLLQTVADQVGSALRSALLHEQLESARSEALLELLEEPQAETTESSSALQARSTAAI